MKQNIIVSVFHFKDKFKKLKIILAQEQYKASNRPNLAH